MIKYLTKYYKENISKDLKFFKNTNILVNDNNVIKFVSRLSKQYKNTIQHELKKTNLQTALVYIYQLCSYSSLNKYKQDKISYKFKKKDQYFKIKKFIFYIKITKKRKRKIIKISKRKKQKMIDWNKWVSAGRTRNYILQDPLLDWLNKYKSKSKTSINTFKDYYLNKGLEFENNVMCDIKQKFKVIQVTDRDARSDKLYKKTITEMKKGTPIIYQAVLRNYQDNTYGIADLLVRSDYLNKLIKTQVLDTNEIKIKAKHLTKYHYRVIDIKYSTLHLFAHTNHLKNTPTSKPYKAQICIYNNALGEMQGYIPDKAYILGYRWKRGHDEGFNCFNILGEVDFQEQDNVYLDRTQEAVKWYKNMISNGHSWSIDPPSRDELRPNMVNHKDEPWRQLKDELAIKYGEITLINGCGVSHRENAFDQKIFRWDDKKCNADTLYIYSSNKSKTTNQLLNINRSNKLIALPKDIRQIQDNPKTCDFYVDFETYTFLPEYQHIGITSMIYLIGVSYIEDNILKYKSFFVKNLNIKEEYRIFQNFSNFIYSKKKRSQTPRLFHWGHAEKYFYNSVIKRHDTKFDLKLKYWYDLLKFIKKNKIVVKGSHNFGLKEYAKAMYKNGFIKTTWKGDMDGVSSLRHIEKYNKLALQQKCTILEIQDSIKILEYNQSDCDVLCDIVMYFRKNT